MVLLDGLYKVIKVNCNVKVIGNLGVTELMNISFGTVFMVTNGTAVIGARITLLGELDKCLLFGELKKVI